MSPTTTTEIPAGGTAMSWEDFDAIGEIWAEYLDGRLVPLPHRDRVHQDCVMHLADLLKSVLGRPRVVHQWSWKPGADEFIPDVLVHPPTDEQVRFTGLPELVVEVISTEPVRDLVVKLDKYAAYGLERYWVLDPEVRELYVFARQGTRLELVQTVGREPAELDVGAGAALVDLATIIPGE